MFTDQSRSGIRAPVIYTIIGPRKKSLDSNPTECRQDDTEQTTHWAADDGIRQNAISSRADWALQFKNFHDPFWG